MYKFKSQEDLIWNLIWKEDLIWNISPTLEIVAGLFFYITQFRRKLHPVLESILQGQIKTWNGMMWHEETSLSPVHNFRTLWYVDMLVLSFSQMSAFGCRHNQIYSNF